MSHLELLARGQREIERASRLQRMTYAVLRRRRGICGGSAREESDRSFHAIIRAKLAFQELPRERPSRMWAGPAEGENTCGGCGQRIERGAIEYESEFARGLTKRFHQKCFGIWNEERIGR